MTEWGNICRICSSPADYEVFAKIPTYLHATSNEFQNWQKPIHLLLEETTGLKIAPDDGLPRCICAPCISYLKHAVNFRDQCISNALSLKIVSVYQQPNSSSNQKLQVAVTTHKEDKESMLITADDLNYVEERQTNNLLLNNQIQQEQPNKVHKQLLNNSNSTRNEENIEQQMRYLNLLFDKDTNAGLRTKHRNGNGTIPMTTINAAGSCADGTYADEEFQTATTSSDDNEEAAAKLNQTFFSYREKNFEEDDVMELDELRNAITINMPESCKERKCRACFRRFMFEESYKEHINTCIEHTFLTFIEDINRLLTLRRNKTISPHEFIRRMIFSFRKTCNWLKANCVDMLLPDLQNSGESDVSKQRLESEGKSSATSSGEQRSKQQMLSAHAKIAKAIEMQQAGRKKSSAPIPTSDHHVKAKCKTLLDLNTFSLDANITGLFAQAKPIRSSTATPITMSNNILYEIERSESRNSNQLKVKKPIPILATAINTNTAGGSISSKETSSTASTYRGMITGSVTPTKMTGSVDAKLIGVSPLMEFKAKDVKCIKNHKQNDAERITFLEKLQKATCPVDMNMQQQAPNRRPSAAGLLFSARCNSCNANFETVAAFEVHNAMHHNTTQIVQPQQKQQQQLQLQQEGQIINKTQDDEQRKRIIALFEDDV